MPSLSLSTSRTKYQARRASDSPVARALARAGLVARGVIWILIGIIAVMIAIGAGRHQADQQGALQILARQPFGSVLLWLMGIGFVGYALWRLSEAAFGVTGEGNGAGARLKSLARGIVYGFFAYMTFQVLSGTAKNQTHHQQDLSASVMKHSGGVFLVGLAGVIIVIVGIALIVEGWKRKFMKFLNTGQMSPQTRRAVQRLGQIGTIARGAVFALTGILVIDAAVTHNASKAGGLDKALLTLRDQAFGEILLLLAAIGLIIFGVYGLAEARWRKV
jgi:Domain of Unknown Function (DUF1206)